jgi:chemotaxis signal transduction protein
MQTDVIPIRLGSTWVLVRAMMVSEFLSRTPWLPVPGSSPLLPGVMTWRGRAIPVLDLAKALQLGAITPLDEYARAMILDHALGAVAVLVDGAREVMPIADEDVHPPHVTRTPYTVGEVATHDSVVPLIEVDQVLRELAKAGA